MTQIVITIERDGRLNVQGPLTNKILMYGALELAKEVVRDYQPSQEPLVQPASADDLNNLPKLVTP